MSGPNSCLALLRPLMVGHSSSSWTTEGSALFPTVMSFSRGLEVAPARRRRHRGLATRSDKHIPEAHRAAAPDRLPSPMVVQNKYIRCSDPRPGPLTRMDIRLLPGEAGRSPDRRGPARPDKQGGGLAAVGTGFSSGNGCRRAFDRPQPNGAQPSHGTPDRGGRLAETSSYRQSRDRPLPWRRRIRGVPGQRAESHRVPGRSRASRNSTQPHGARLPPCCFRCRRRVPCYPTLLGTEHGRDPRRRRWIPRCRGLRTSGR